MINDLFVERLNYGMLEIRAQSWVVLFVIVQSEYALKELIESLGKYYIHSNFNQHFDLCKNPTLIKSNKNIWQIGDYFSNKSFQNSFFFLSFFSLQTKTSEMYINLLEEQKNIKKIGFFIIHSIFTSVIHFAFKTEFNISINDGMVKA